MAETTSQSLIADINNGHFDAAFDKIVRRYTPALTAFLRSQGYLSEEDLKDFLQELLLTVFGIFKSGFRHNNREGALRRFLREVARRRLLAYWRDRSDQQRFHQQPEEVWAELEDDQSAVWQPLVDLEDQILIDAALVQLSLELGDKTVEAFRQFFGGRTAVEVASNLDMSAGAVRSANFRCRKRLREILPFLAGGGSFS
jgi:RNA polymerase sigma factor (sigma-70 family)